MYLRYCCASKKKGTNKAKNIIFYALSVLYVLSMASMVLDFVLADVSKNDLELTYFLLICCGA